MDTWKLILEYAAPTVITVLAGVLAVLGKYAIRWIAARLHLDDALLVERMTDAYRDAVRGGVTFAEQQALRWARERNELPPGSRKLQWALEFASREVALRGLPAMASDRLGSWIESMLGDPSEPGVSVGGKSASEALRNQVPRG